MSHSSTSATASSAFAADEPLDERGAAWAAAAHGRVRRVDQARCAPAPACRQTAAALGLDAAVDPGLHDWDLGRWRGRTLDDVAADEPEAVQSWLTSPQQAAHGGESLADLLDRVGAWLQTVEGGHTAAVMHPAVVRAAILVVLGAPAQGFWRVDIAPLSTTVLRGGPGRWTLRASGVSLRDDRRAGD